VNAAAERQKALAELIPSPPDLAGVIWRESLILGSAGGLSIDEAREIGREEARRTDRNFVEPSLDPRVLALPKLTKSKEQP
jgi:hypothetical protein